LDYAQKVPKKAFSFRSGAKNFRIESECLELSAPFRRQIAEPLDADAAGQATLCGSFDKIGREEGKRDGQVDLPDATFLASAKFCDRGYST